MSDLKSQLVRIAHANPGEIRDALIPLIHGKKAGDIPRATRRPAGKKFRENLAEWVRRDAQEKLEAAGVSQRLINSLIQVVDDFVIRFENWDGKFRYFETQGEAVDFLTGKLSLPNLTGTGGKGNYPDILEAHIKAYGGGNQAYQDKVKGLLNKMSPWQKSLAYWASSVSLRGDVEKLEKSLADTSRENYKRQIPVLEWALKIKPLKNASSRRASVPRLSGREERMWEQVMLAAENDGAAYKRRDPVKAIKAAWKDYRKRNARERKGLAKSIRKDLLQATEDWMGTGEYQEPRYRDRDQEAAWDNVWLLIRNDGAHYRQSDPTGAVGTALSQWEKFQSEHENEFFQSYGMDLVRGLGKKWRPV